MTIDYTKSFPFDLYNSTGVQFKLASKKKSIPPRTKELIKNLATKKVTVTPLLQTIMKGKEADTKIKLSKQQGKEPDYNDLLAFHNMSENIEVTYGKTNKGDEKNNLDKKPHKPKEKFDYGNKKRNGYQPIHMAVDPKQRPTK